MTFVMANHFLDINFVHWTQEYLILKRDLYTADFRFGWMTEDYRKKMLACCDEGRNKLTSLKFNSINI